MTHVLLNGHRSWAKVPELAREKAKRRPGEEVPTVVLLHGGLSKSATMLRVLGPGLAKHFSVAAFDRRGHGRTRDTPEPFSFGAMAEETVAFLTYLDRPVHLVGHSDGANVALLVAQSRGDLVERVVAVGANYHVDGLVPVPELVAEGEDYQAFVADYASYAPDGVEHARAVFEKARDLWRTGPTMTVADLASITTPVLVMVGDDDVVRLSHTASLYEALPEAQLAVVPGASHLLLKERTKLCVRLITDFLVGPSPPVTYAPLRRSRVED